jgi:uncharacterized protein (DUF1499 family)
MPIRAFNAVFNVAFLSLCLATVGAAGAQTVVLPVAEGTLACPPTPNCVNSLDKGLAPLAFLGEPAKGMAQLRATLATFAEAAVQRSDALTLVAVFTTPLGFRDEVEFRVDGSAQAIHYRSRSLTGFYDFGKNRSRMQEVKMRFDALR